MPPVNDADVLVIGGGIFGCMAAIELAASDMKVKLIEKHSSLLSGASFNNQNRLHLGYHYPRDLYTAIQCKLGFDEFKNTFKKSILSNFSNAYFISSSGSKINFSAYKDFCLKAGLETLQVDYKQFDEPVWNTEGGILANEAIYDAGIVRNEILTKMRENSIEVSCDDAATGIKRQAEGFLIDAYKGSINAKAVLNCTYANLNSFNRMLGLEARKFQFELTSIPIIKWRKAKSPIGITIMDGPFFTILPFGKSGNYLLYHVQHAVHNSTVSEMYPSEWNCLDRAIPDTEAYKSFKKIVRDASHWLPSIKHSEYLGCLKSIRMVLANQDSSDQRPSFIEQLDKGSPFYSVFSGKIDHSLMTARAVAKKIKVLLM